MDVTDFQNSTARGNTSVIQTLPYNLWEIITITTVSALVSLITIVGNILVMLSFKVNSQLKTVNNYYLLSLAFADLIIGVFSMNLYTSYILMGYWSLGHIACDLWLALDYVASNASVMNLLVISFDRYFSVTRPLTYRAKRTPKRAGIMIGMAWLVSFILWAPPILCWQYFVGERTVPPDQCYIQFFSEPVITFGTAIAAFYIPISIMTILYWLTSVNNMWTKSDHMTSFNSYTSSEDEERPISEATSQESYKNQEPEPNEPSTCYEESHNFNNALKYCSQKNHKKCISYKFKPILKPISPQKGNSEAERSSHPCSSSEQLALSSPSSSTKPMDPNLKNQITKRKRMVLVKEKKAAQTLSAILLAFILTWTPYNIMVLISTFCSDCIPLSLWHLGYWLCYVNSTINPMCYALCNKTFQKTFRMLLFCKWKKSRASHFIIK
uniref:Muscarinic acetylcholine receptor n=1 Tax=Electrophorus electricus TaxID=8005 RepID=A0A4W4F989_ELEEL